MPATFFLSGRALHGRAVTGSSISRRFSSRTANIGLRRRSESPRLRRGAGAGVRSKRGRAAARDRSGCGLARTGRARSSGDGTLGASGMTIGFHTVDHAYSPRWPAGPSTGGLGTVATFSASQRVPDTLLRLSVRQGRRALGRRCPRAGYEAAFTGRAQPLRRSDDRYRLGRWEPGRIGVDDLLVKLAVRLHRAAPASRGAS